MKKKSLILIAFFLASIMGCSGAKEQSSFNNNLRAQNSNTNSKFSESIGLKSIIKEGVAYIGHGITVEEAKNVAINDARQKALNSLGAFFESQKVVQDGRLTKSELSSITGAIMKSKVLDSKKEVKGEMFVLRLNIQFDVDMKSFNRALEKYYANSDAKKTYIKLMSIIQKQQIALKNAERGSFSTIEIADEIEYINKRLGKVLTTGQKINRDLEIKKQYEKKLTQLLTRFAHSFVMELRGSYDNNDIPNSNGYFIWRINKKRKGLMQDSLFEKLQVINEVINQYTAEDVKTHPKIVFSLSIQYSFFGYINENKFEIRMIGEERSGKYKPNKNSFSPVILKLISDGKTFKYCTPTNPFQSMPGKPNSHLIRIFSNGRYSTIYKSSLGTWKFKLDRYMSDSAWRRAMDNFFNAKDEMKIYLPKGSDYKNISTVDFRWPKLNPENIKIKFEYLN